MKTRILIGAPVRQDHETFYKYLKALNRLETDGLEVDFFFILHNSERLKRFLKPDQCAIYKSDSIYRRDGLTHHWTNKNLLDVIEMKNYLLSRTVEYNYDYFFLVDSDLILNPDTLQRLISRNKKIIAQCFWTKWTPDQDEQPNAWQYDFYSFNTSNEYEDWKFPQVVPVGGSGACILIHRSVIESGVNYTPIPNVSFSIWEDRAFCIRAAVKGYEIYLDTTSPPDHLYRKT